MSYKILGYAILLSYNTFSISLKLCNISQVVRHKPFRSNYCKGKGVDIVAAFHNDYKSVADFEQKNGVKLPPDIAAMLGG